MGVGGSMLMGSFNMLFLALDIHLDIVSFLRVFCIICPPEKIKFRVMINYSKCFFFLTDCNFIFFFKYYILLYFIDLEIKIQPIRFERIIDRTFWRHYRCLSALVSNEFSKQTTAELDGNGIFGKQLVN
jgi:hypothetical protein